MVPTQMKRIARLDELRTDLVVLDHYINTSQTKEARKALRFLYKLCRATIDRLQREQNAV